MNRLCNTLGGCALLFLSACYSFSGISIGPDVETFYVRPFDNNALNAVPNLEQDLTVDLQDKVRLESRLNLVNESQDPDVIFRGTLVDFRISSEAPQADQTVDINRLTVTLAIEYINTPEEKEWKRNFSFFFDFPATTDLASIQDEAIQTISDQLMEDIFNAAFTEDW